MAHDTKSHSDRRSRLVTESSRRWLDSLHRHTGARATIIIHEPCGCVWETGNMEEPARTRALMRSADDRRPNTPEH